MTTQPIDGEIQGCTHVISTKMADGYEPPSASLHPAASTNLPPTMLTGGDFDPTPDTGGRLVRFIPAPDEHEDEDVYRAVGMVLVQLADGPLDTGDFFEWHPCPKCPRADPSVPEYGRCACSGEPWPSAMVRAAVDRAVELTEQRVRAEIEALAEQPRYIPFRDPLPDVVHRRVQLTPELFYDFDADGQAVGMGTTCGASALLRMLAQLAPELLTGMDDDAGYRARVESAEARYDEVRAKLAATNETLPASTGGKSAEVSKPSAPPEGARVPTGWRRDVEWARQRDVGENGHWQSEPLYREDHARRDLRRKEYVVRREIHAGPWVPVDGERPDA